LTRAPDLANATVHPVRTIKMDLFALRVVDTSFVPEIISGNSNPEDRRNFGPADAFTDGDGVGTSA
jgi:hypothetical protein